LSAVAATESDSIEPTPSGITPRARVPSDGVADAPNEAPIRAVFQPIVDLLTGLPIGYEALSRSDREPERMFAEARRDGTVWELEQRCRQATLERLAEMRHLHENRLFFLNVSPDVLEDPRFAEDFNAERLRRYGIAPSSVVLEITEKQSISDHARVEGLVRAYMSQGFQFAVDDFGSGHSSLLALVACAPRFIKLDGAVVRDVHLHSYRRHLVRALNAFAASVDSRLVAEGVEQWEEIETLMRLGVRYAQGFLFARPAAEPPEVSNQLAGHLRDALSKAEGAFGDTDEHIESLVEPVLALTVGQVTVEEVHVMFRNRPALDHLVLVDGRRPYGLVTREDLSARLAGRYAYALRYNKPAERAAKCHALVVSSDAKITTLASHAMERAPADLYDPVLVVDSQGSLVGTVTIKSLIKRSIELQVRTAQGANPLTGLPGNRAIQRWIEAEITSPTLTVVYADLDRFKEYNDCYGFLMGDEMIRLAARILSRLASGTSEGRLGHVGGDDFVAVFSNGVGADALARACAEFDDEKQSLFDAADLERRYLVARNRRGDVEHVPLVTISIAVIEASKLSGPVHPAALSHVAASLKALAKKKTAEQGQSAFVIERRSYPADDPAGHA
jgi:diguanylate cyclase (GGDEF)-like protein